MHRMQHLRPMVVAPSGSNYVTVESFCWDQNKDAIRIFIFIEGVEQNKLQAVFSQTSVRIKLDDVNGKNYQWAIPKLNKEIVPEKCKAVAKATKVVITLCKASTGTWPNIHFQENKYKPIEANDDDLVSRVDDFLKNMYECGGDDIKQALEKAYHEAMSGKTV